MDFPEIEAFKKLNESMKIHQLFQLVHYIDRHFEEASRLQSDLADSPGLVDLLRSYLNGFDPKDENRSVFAALSKKLTKQMTYKHFVGLMVPIERQFNRSVVDSDFVVRKGDRTKNNKTKPIIVILDNLRSAINVGSIFRTAECLGAKEIYLCGYTATPENPKVAKASMGTSSLTPFRWFSHVDEAIELIKSEGGEVYAVETCAGAQQLHEIGFCTDDPTSVTAVIVGNERHGLNETVLKQCDGVIAIPMQGKKNSLNVAVTAGIVLHWILSGLTQH